MRHRQRKSRYKKKNKLLHRLRTKWKQVGAPYARQVTAWSTTLLMPINQWFITQLMAYDLPWKTKKQRQYRRHPRANPRLHYRRRNLINYNRRRAINFARATPYIPPARWSEIAYEKNQYESQERFDKKEKVQLAWKRWRASKQPRLMCLTAHAMSTHTHASKRTKAKYMVFDAGSYPILVDNCASSSITNSLADFVSPPKATSKVIQGVNGELTALRVGTIVWHIQDDNGRLHHLTLPNAYYAPTSPYRLLSPQHWA